MLLEKGFEYWRRFAVLYKIDRKKLLERKWDFAFFIVMAIYPVTLFFVVIFWTSSIMFAINPALKITEFSNYTAIIKSVYSTILVFGFSTLWGQIKQWLQSRESNLQGKKGNTVLVSLLFSLIILMILCFIIPKIKPELACCVYFGGITGIILILVLQVLNQFIIKKETIKIAEKLMKIQLIRIRNKRFSHKRKR